MNIVILLGGWAALFVVASLVGRRLATVRRAQEAADVDYHLRHCVAPGVWVTAADIADNWVDDCRAARPSTNGHTNARVHA